MAALAQQLTIRVTCSDLPPLEHAGQPTDLGLQNKQQQLEPGIVVEKSLQFTFQITLQSANPDSEFDFSGAYVHGPRAGRFVYIGYRPQGSETWIGRWKIPLYEIPAAQIMAAIERPGSILSAQVSLKRTGTTRPVGDGWQV